MALRQILSSRPLLTYIDFNRTVYIFSDASDLASGGCCLQIDDNTGKFAPVGFCGRKFSESEAKCCILEKECMALIFTISSFRMHLIQRFVALTDNNSLKHILSSQKKLSPKMERWILFLSDWQFDIEHIKGSLNVIADALSRRTYSYTSTPADTEVADFPFIPGLEERMSAVNAITRAHTRREHEEQKNIQEEQKWLAQSKLALPVETGTVHKVYHANSHKQTKTDMEPCNSESIVVNHPSLAKSNSTSVSTSSMSNDKDGGKQTDGNLHRELPFNQSANDREMADTFKSTSQKDITQQVQTAQTKIEQWKNDKLKPSLQPKRDQIDANHYNQAADDIWDNEKWSDVHIQGFSRHDIMTAQCRDTYCNDIILYLQQGILPPTARRQRICVLREQDYIIVGKLLYLICSAPPGHRDMEMRLVIPQSLQRQVIEAVHLSGIGAHMGMKRTAALLRSRFAWNGMVSQTRRFIGSCDICLRAKTSLKLEQTQRTLFDLAQ